jgi:hypothetical protein
MQGRQDSNKLYFHFLLYTTNIKVSVIPQSIDYSLFSNKRNIFFSNNWLKNNAKKILSIYSDLRWVRFSCIATYTANNPCSLRIPVADMKWIDRTKLEAKEIFLFNFKKNYSWINCWFLSVILGAQICLTVFWDTTKNTVITFYNNIRLNIWRVNMLVVLKFN